MNNTKIVKQVQKKIFKKIGILCTIRTISLKSFEQQSPKDILIIYQREPFDTTAHLFQANTYHCKKLNHNIFFININMINFIEYILRMTNTSNVI